MKKFMTVLLVIAVMFTFSFSTAFAVTNTEANLIKQAADYAKAQLPEAVQKAYTAVVSGGTANTYITTAAWEAAAADIVEAFEDAIDTTTDAYLDGTTTPVSGWNAYDYVYAAGKLYAGYDYATLAGQFASDADPSAIMAAKEQFRLDLAEAMLVYDKVDLAGLYSTTAPTTGKTYYEQAAEAIETAKASLNKYFINKDGDIINVSPTVGGIANDVTVVKGWITNGFAGNATLDVDAFKGVKGKVYEGTSIVEYYYVDGIPTIAKVEADEATAAARAAAAKAAAQAAYATYIADTTNADYNKTFAADWLTVVSFLADENEIDGYSATALLGGMTYADGIPAEVAKYADAIADVTALEAYAAKCVAEKNADGIAVRDAEDVQDIVDEFKLAAYKYAAGLGTAPSLASAMGDIAVLSIETAADKLAFDKEAEKADLEDAMDAIIDNYYALEAAAVKAAYETAYAKVDAAEKTTEFVTIRTALNKEVAKIKIKSAVEGLFTSGKMATELDKQDKALKAYLAYVNSGVKAYDDAYINYVAGNLATMLRDYYIANDARTVAEMQALTGAVEAVTASLPTNADLAAAKKAADDAIKALPSAATTTAADLDAYNAALDLAKAYNKMVKTATGTAGTTAIPAAKISALQTAIQQEINLAYAKADKTDKAALKAIAAEVTAANKNVGSTKLFATKFVNPTTAALAKIKTNEAAAVTAAINAIPFTLTEADKATVEKARELYDAYVAEYTDYDIARGTATPDGYVADDFDLTTLVRAEAALGLNDNSKAEIIASVEGLKIKANSSAKKGSITVKWTVTGNTENVEKYQVYKSTKAQKGYKKAITTTKTSFKNTKNLEKGTRYYYKVRAYVTVDGVKYYSDWSNKANRIAK